MLKVSDFLNPKSMLTPGIAGAVIMLVTNTLWVQFGFPQKWTALILSFMLGSLSFIHGAVPPWQKVIYYVLNSLIIFSVGIGTNAVGTKIGASNNSSVNQSGSIFSINSAYAQTKNEDATDKKTTDQTVTKRTGSVNQNARVTSKATTTSRAFRSIAGADKSQEIQKAAAKETNRQFFQGW